MSQPVTVSEAQDQLLETAFDLYRIMQRLHHQHEGLKAQYEPIRKYYEAEAPRLRTGHVHSSWKWRNRPMSPSIILRTWPKIC